MQFERVCQGAAWLGSLPRRVEGPAEVHLAAPPSALGSRETSSQSLENLQRTAKTCLLVVKSTDTERSPDDVRPVAAECDTLRTFLLLEPRSLGHTVPNATSGHSMSPRVSFGRGINGATVAWRANLFFARTRVFSPSFDLRLFSCSPKAAARRYKNRTARTPLRQRLDSLNRDGRCGLRCPRSFLTRQSDASERCNRAFHCYFVVRRVNLVVLEERRTARSSAFAIRALEQPLVLLRENVLPS